MTILPAQLIKQAQAAIAEHQPVALDPVEQARNYFGLEAWHEIDRFHATSELPRTVRGLELLQIEIELDEKV